MSLMLHMGTQAVERSALSQVELPVGTSTHMPIPHDYFVNLIQDRLEDRGLRVSEEGHGLSKDGANYFGMFTLAPSYQQNDDDFKLVVGMRNSHVKRFGAGLVTGANVMVCDNLSFSGEVKAVRKHTNRILDDLPVLVAQSIEKVVDMGEFQQRRFEAYKERQLKTFEAEHLMVEMLRRGVMNAHRLPKLVEQWDNPDHLEFTNTGRSAWRLFNGATEALKGTNVVDVTRKTQKLHTLIDEVVELAA